MTMPRVSRPGPLTVTLPGTDTVPKPFRGQPYTLLALLGAGDDNPKLLKSNRAGTKYKTWGLSLAPATQSGYQACASSTPACRRHCLHYQGHGRLFVAVPVARVAKTIAFFEHRDWFEERLAYELDRLSEHSFLPAVRLNVFSDIMWEGIFPWMFDLPIQFYDYTKHVKRMLAWCEGRLPPTYHLTFSRSESNEAGALEVLARGGSVSVVFRDRRLPKTWQTFDVFDGDRTDLRFLDPPNVVVGLRAKGTARFDRSGFVVDPDRPARRSLLTLRD